MINIKMVEKTLKKTTKKKKTAKGIRGVPNSLTPKQEKFCQRIAFGKSITYSDALRQSYDCKNSSGRSINAQACELIKKPKITARINELRREIVKDICYDIKDAMKELTEAYKGAKSRGDGSNEIKAIVEKCKLLGIYEEVLRLKGDKSAPLESNITIELIEKK